MIRDEVKNLTADARTQFKWNHARHGGARIHLFETKDDDKDLVPVVGDLNLYFAVRESVVVFAVGKDGLAAIKQALDDLAGRAPPESDAGRLEVQAVKLAAFALEAGGKKEMLDKLRKAFPNPDKTRPPVSIRASWDTAARVRYAVPIELLRLIPVFENKPGGK